MTWKQRLPFFPRDEKKEPLVRIDGSLSGDALLEEGTLTRLREVAEAVSAARPYTYDLQLAGGRFSLIMLEAILPLNLLESDPEQAIARDLQNILEAMPPQERTQVRSTFRALWHEGVEVVGVAFSVEPPGRIATQKRVRTEEEYDRLAEEQALHGYGPPSKRVLPGWAAILMGLLVLAAGTYLIYYMSPDRHLKSLESAMHQVDLAGLEDLIEIRDLRFNIEGVELTIQPLPGYKDRLEMNLTPGRPPEPGTDATLERLAAEALVKGRLNLEIFDRDGVLLKSVLLHLGAFDGSMPTTIRTGPLRLSTEPAKVRIGP